MLALTRITLFLFENFLLGFQKKIQKKVGQLSEIWLWGLWSRTKKVKIITPLVMSMVSFKVKKKNEKEVETKEVVKEHLCILPLY